MSRPGLLALSFVFLLPVAPLEASDTAPDEARARLRTYLAADGGRLTDELASAARDRGYFCVRCHGETGVSRMPLVPNLAGQNAYYLLEQIERFASGERNDHIMTPLARQLAPDDRALLAFYYASQRPRPHAIEATLKERGEARYRQVCVACHGSDARGGERAVRASREPASGVPAPPSVSVPGAHRRRGECDDRDRAHAFRRRHQRHRRLPGLATLKFLRRVPTLRSGRAETSVLRRVRSGAAAGIRVDPCQTSPGGPRLACSD